MKNDNIVIHSLESVAALNKVFQSEEFIGDIKNGIQALFFNPSGCQITHPELKDFCEIHVKEATLFERSEHCVHRLVPDSAVKGMMVSAFYDKFGGIPGYLRDLINDLIDGVGQAKVEVVLTKPVDLVDLNILYRTLANYHNGVIVVRNVDDEAPQYLTHPKISVDSKLDYFYKDTDTKNGVEVTVPTKYQGDRECLLNQMN